MLRTPSQMFQPLYNFILIILQHISNIIDLWLSPALKRDEPITVRIAIPIHWDILCLDVHWNALQKVSFVRFYELFLRFEV